MNVAGVLAAGRQLAASLMVDTCSIVAHGGQQSFAASTGQSVVGESPIYSGPCRIQAPQAQPRDAAAGGMASTQQRIVVSVPVVGSEGAMVRCLVRITAAINDTDLVGRTFVVVGLHHKTFATARRLECLEVAR